MKRGVLIICDREEVYARRLMDYLNRKGRFFEICVFTAVDALLDYVRSHKADILLIEEELWEDGLLGRAAGKIILLSESAKVHREDSRAVIYKLQSAENIEKEIMGCYAAEDEGEFPGLEIGQGIELWGVFSPVGGSGKTTFALALGEWLAKRKNVLYLNFESFGSLVGNGSYRGGMTDLLYYVKERKENLYSLLPTLAEKRQELDCILPVDYYGDLLSVEREDADYLVSQLERSQYETAILDFGCQTPALFTLLARCHRIFLPRQREEAQGKLAAMERSLRIENREELFLRMEKVLVPNVRGSEMERFLWGITKNG